MIMIGIFNLNAILMSFGTLSIFLRVLEVRAALNTNIGIDVGPVSAFLKL